MRILFVLMLLASCVFSAVAVVPSDFTTGVGGIAAHFATNLYFESDMDCGYTGIVLEGTPCTTPATVCPGGSLYVVPSNNALWARTYADIVTGYPYCSGGGYCPGMISYSSLNTNRYIDWLSDSMFDAYDIAADGTGHAQYSLHTGTEGIERYDELGTFHTQRMSYYNVTDGPIYTNKKGEANVFCNGNVEVVVNGHAFDVRNIESSGIVPVPLSSEGIYTVSTRMVGVHCFASAVKNPLDRDRPEFFNLRLYGEDTPSIPSVSSDSVTFTVENRLPSLIVTSVDMTSYGPNYLLEITLRNNGTVPVRITRVTPIGSGLTAPLGPSACLTYGIPTPPCPSSSGFGVTINPGNTHTVHVFYGGTPSGDIVRLYYEAFEPVCSSETEFSVDVSVDPDIVRCEVEPPSLDAGPYEIHEYEVTCYNILGSEVSCTGNNWYWVSMGGDFIDRTDSDALAYQTDPPGSSGRICYSPAISTHVECCSDITSSEDSPFLDCELDPSSADLSIGESQWFDLNCYMDGVETPPNSADYDNVDGLDGFIGDSSIDGTNFTGTVDSEGNLMAIGWKSHHGDPTLRGAVAFAHIVVGEGENLTTNETNETTTDGDERGDRCELIPGYTEKYPHDGGTVRILCGEEPPRVPCGSGTEVVWDIDSELYGSSVPIPSPGGYIGASYTIGSEGEPEYGRTYLVAILATVNPGEENEGHCWMDIYIREPSCLEYT